MVQVKFYLLIVALCACCGLGSSGMTIPSKPEMIPVDNNTAENTSSTEHPIITTSPKSPLSPDTTTTTPSVTTTPTTTTTSTTTNPAPTPTPNPTPTPPTPLPPPEEHTWSFPPNSSNVTCIVVKFAAQLNVTYSSGGKSLSNKVLNIPTNATVSDGDCGATDQFLTLSWPTPGGSPAINNMLTLAFGKNDSTKTYALKSLDIQLSPELFNASFTTVVELKYGEAWRTPVATSYRCTPATRLNMTVASDPVEGQAAYITFTKLQEEAFRTVNGTQFSAARECGGDVPDAVPIAVGCALGGLVLVVLVAYLVGRRRSSARGYLSM